jgi:ATP-dependent RNA helicase HelY
MIPATAATRFLDAQPFPPDPFQVEAVAAIDRGESVVVTAPTGAGKTLVAQAAVEQALAEGRRAFYTAPIKALSNQKYGEFRDLYGERGVGLLTGDNVINGDAPVVVMTTEVLRNMIYADSTALDALAVVVLDEVHYLQDPYRGSVWEEVIIHLPGRIRLVCLSATIANAGEFTGWVRSRRGSTALVVEEHRPVPLESLFAVKDRYHGGELMFYPVFGRDGRRPNPQVVKLLRKSRGRYRRFASVRRLDVAESLAAEGLLPAIYFIFSRAGCEAAAAQAAGAGLDLTTPEERSTIAEVAEARIRHLPPDDLGVLGYDSWLAQLEKGVAAHHAGMVPAFKEAVEDLFAAGLVKLVFATETLALGINMPARSVVLESLSKFTGESHELLQPGDYTQLTGRAGRRGIDSKGSAVVLPNRDVPFERLAGIAGAGSHPLVSSFQPSYNMAVNLVANYEQSRAEELLDASFAQYRDEERRRALQEAVAEKEEELAAMRAAATCEKGDIWAFVETQSASSEATEAELADVQPGDVLELAAGADPAVVLARSWGGKSPQVLLIDGTHSVRKQRPADLPQATRVVGAIDLPEPFRPRERAYQREVLERLEDWTGGAGRHDPVAAVAPPRDLVATCPDLREHRRWVKRAKRAEDQLRRLQRRVERRRPGMVGRFRAILAVLEGWGYVDGWSLTDRGERLRFVYNELDLLLTESILRGSMDDLNPAQLAALTSVFTFEARPRDQIGGWPDGDLAERGDRILALWEDLVEAEGARRVPESRRPDSGFAEVMHAWAAGAELDDLFGEDEFAAGDFVRNCRQLLDLLRQVRDAFPELADAAGSAVKAVDRGVVAAGGRL